MFDQIDAAYYLQKARYARERATDSLDSKMAEALQRRAAFYEDQARRYDAGARAA